MVWYLSADMSPLDRETRERITPDNSAIAEEGKVPFDERFDRDFADELFGRVAYDLLPSGLLGLLLVAALAATMSTADTRMLASSALFTGGIYKRFLRTNASERHCLWVGRLSGFGIVALSLILQTTFTDVIAALKFVIKTIAPIGISFWIGIAWRGWTPIAVWISSLTAYGMWFFCAYFPQWLSALGVGQPVVVAAGDHVKVADAWMMLLYLSAGVVSGLLVSFVTPRPPREQLDDFFRLLRTPVRLGEHVAAPCTLPENPAPQVAKLFDHPDFELPRPSRLGIAGFVVAWFFVALIVWIPYWLSRP